jgi:hypothetical protein
MEGEILFCKTPVVFIIFNRPNESEKTFNAIKKVKPERLFVISDGPRDWATTDIENVFKCRELLNLIDWECEITPIFSEVNLGCMRRIVTGLNEVFRIVEKAIILEDDCVPTVDFFRFMEWGLNQFSNEPSIGMISGSNLIAHKIMPKERNGFSSFINIWGWGTWKRVWEKHDPYLSLSEIKGNMVCIKKNLNLKWWEAMYWKELFKYSVYASSTWDFQVQYSFFKNRLMSVYPAVNLIHNIGFSGNGTHTNVEEPEYIRKNLPNNNSDIFSRDVDISKKIDFIRDKMLASEIWHYNIFTAIRLRLMNILRLNF